MTLATLPWWGWLVLSAVLFLLIIFTDEENRFARGLLILGMALSAVIGVIRFVKWVWNW